MPQHYPFTAVVGPEDRPDDLAIALLLTTISPEVGGVLVRGEKGTAKSTMVRALADVLPPIEVVAGDRFSSHPGDASLSPDGPFPADALTEVRPVRLVELPIGATEDRLLGSLHLEKALAEGRTEYEPGLLARAHRGILYVDEVNLLHDHLVDLLLDAAAMGRSTVERDGVSVTHHARFVLVGTMNPEEGELRPQLLDRFGLTVEVAAPRDPRLRAEVVRRRLAFDADPVGFAASYDDSERALRDRIVAAAKLLREVEVTHADLLKVAEVCAAFDVDGLRADIVTTRAAVAHAAWHGRTALTRADIRAAARLALPHRRRRNPFDAPGLDEDLLDRILGEDEPEPDPDPQGGPGGPTNPEPPEADGGPDTGVSSEDPGPASESPSDSPATAQGDSSADVDTRHPDVEGRISDSDSPDSAPADAGAGPDQPAVAAQAPHRTRLFTVAGIGAGEAGRRSRAITSSGRRIGATRPVGRSGTLHLTETIRAAAPHQVARGRTSGRLALAPADLRVATREGKESNLVLFCVDASGSMAARTRMEQVKTAILSLLLDAYQRRDKVGLVTFRGDAGELALPPTHSVDVAARRLDELPAGGRTPLAEGLMTAAGTLRLERLRDPRRRPLLVVVTDGRATHGPDAVARSHHAAAALGDDLGRAGASSLVLDCETGRFRMGLAVALAGHLRAGHVAVGDVTADALAGVVRGATASPLPRLGEGAA